MGSLLFISEWPTDTAKARRQGCMRRGVRSSAVTVGVRDIPIVAPIADRSIAIVSLARGAPLKWREPEAVGNFPSTDKMNVVWIEGHLPPTRDPSKPNLVGRRRGGCQTQVLVAVCVSECECEKQ
jgi:hypothetical protein